MNASELFRAGKLGEAIEAQIQSVKVHPADHARRLFLFELLAFSGDLDRARKQIEAVNYGQIELDAAVMNYRKLLDAEKQRRELFTQGRTPKFFGEPSRQCLQRVQAIGHLRGNRPAEALSLLKEASAGEAIKGKLNGKPFTSLRDCDDVFGSVLEVMAHGEYYWVPLNTLATLAMNPPKYPRDLLWTPARMELQDGGSGDVFLPAIYPMSHEHSDPQIRLGRMTDWKPSENGPTVGVGARVFLVDDEDIGLLDWRELVIEIAA
jgi:type VI secretion system protein ImpE